MRDPVDADDRAEDARRGEPEVPSAGGDVELAGADLRHQVVDDPGAAVSDLRIWRHEVVVPDESEERILAPPDIPPHRLFVCGVGADAAVGSLRRHERLYRAVDDGGEFGVAQIAVGQYRRADDLAPEFAAPRAVAFIAEPERLDELVVVDLFESLFRGAPERFAQYSVESYSGSVICHFRRPPVVFSLEYTAARR